MNKWIVVLLAATCAAFAGDGKFTNTYTGGGYGSTGSTLGSDGTAKFDGDIWAGGKLKLEANYIYDEGTAANAVWQQHVTTDTGTRYYLIPNGNPAGASSAIKLFATDWVADGTNYQDFGFYVTDALTAISTNGYVGVINSKTAGTLTDPMDIMIGFQDGTEIAARAVYGAGDPGIIFGSGTTNYMSTHSRTQHELDALFLNNVGQRWLNATGTANCTAKVNASNQYVITLLGVASMTLTTTSLTHPGDARFDGGDIGLTADTDLIGIAANAVTVRGSLTSTGPSVSSTVTTFTADDTTPTVAAGNIFVVPGTWTNPGAHEYDITAFDDGATGQEITVIGGDTDCVVKDAGTLKLAGDWTADPDDTLVLVFTGTNWYEKSRSAN